jgi:hypothetical protein
MLLLAAHIPMIFLIITSGESPSTAVRLTQSLVAVVRPETVVIIQIALAKRMLVLSHQVHTLLGICSPTRDTLIPISYSLRPAIPCAEDPISSSTVVTANLAIHPSVVL